MLKELAGGRLRSSPDPAERCVLEAMDGLRSVLLAFSGLPFLGLLPGQSALAPISESATECLTSRNIPNVIAALRVWQDVHPLGAFEVAILIRKLEALMAALATQDAGRPSGPPRHRLRRQR
jgi:hypothetical protein